MIDFLGIAGAQLFIALAMSIVGVLLVLLLFNYKKRIKVVDRLLGAQQKILLINFSKNRIIGAIVLQSIAIILLLITLLRPAWGTKESIIEQEGRDVLIALDVSRSMLAQDRSPNRLEFAKEKVKHLVKQLAAERVGLLLFSGSTILQCPLTTDYATFFLFLDQIDAETISSGSTALDQAIEKALSVFRQMPSKKTKLLLVLTDGEDFSSNLSGVKDQAIKEGLTIFTIGLGTTEGAPIPVLDTNGQKIDYQKDASGSVVISRLNEGILRALAEQSGGVYIHAQSDNKDVADVVHHVQRFEKEMFEQRQVVQLEERYHYCAMLALLTLLGAWLL